MRRHLHWVIICLFLCALAFDLIVWGAAARLPDVGPHMLESARQEGPLAYVYMQAGSVLDQAVPALDAWGRERATAALSDGFERIKVEPTIAMDLIFSNTWNSHHSTLKLMHWAAPVLAVLSLIFWIRRPKKVQMMRSRR